MNKEWQKHRHLHYASYIAVLTWQDIKKEISKYNSILLCSLERKIICMLPLLMVQNHNVETKQGIQIWTFIQTPPFGLSSLLDPRLEGTYFLSSGRLVFCKASSNSYTSQLKILGGESQFWLPQTRLANLTGNPQMKSQLEACTTAQSLPGRSSASRRAQQPPRYSFITLWGRLHV